MDATDGEKCGVRSNTLIVGVSERADVLIDVESTAVVDIGVEVVVVTETIQSSLADVAEGRR